jgi:hypothetical protein
VKFISHRGNLDGPNSNLENRPDYVEKAIAAGFVVEVDLRLIGNQYFLGHDYPVWPVSMQWLNENRESLLLHLKDIASLHSMIPQFHYFCHVNDPYTFTSQGRVWIHDLSMMPDDRSIIPLMTQDLIRSYPYKKHVHAICSDYQVDADGNVYNVPRGTT